MQHTALTRRWTRTTSLAALPALWMSAALASADDLSTMHQFDISPQSLDTALLAFSRVTRVQVIMWAGESSSRRSAGVVGRRVAIDALRAILLDTGLRFQQVDATTVAILRTDVPSPGGAGQDKPTDAIRTMQATGEANASGATSLKGAAEASESSRQNDDDRMNELIVTGTLLRGVAPTGTNVFSMPRTVIAELGAVNTNQVLARVPQVSSAFNQTPALPPLDPGVSIIRPNLRNMSAAGGTTTLVLIDGHRSVNAGILLTSPDPDVIPPGVLERVEIVPDGGSSIYGSDAVGGVINFITRKRFDGIEADARYGLADNYNSFDTNLTAGQDWGSGSAYVSYAYAKHDEILGRDRDYVRQLTSNTLTCTPGTVTVTRGTSSTTYSLPGRVPNTTATCDNTDTRAIYPEEQRHSVFASYVQELSSTLELDVRAFYTKRETDLSVDLNRPGDYGQIATIPASNPYYVQIAPDPGTQTVSFSYAGLMDHRRHNALDELGITPTFTLDLGGTWQLRALGNYGRSDVVLLSPEVNQIAQRAALAATTPDQALNPYDIRATNPGVLDTILREQRARGVQTLRNARVVLDGSAFSLSGGDVRVAAGAEYIRESLENSIVGNFVGATAVNRNVKSAFAEVSIPIVGDGNAMTGIQSLTFSASGRYDDYSDFGDTFNPKLGISYNPVSWTTLRGNWGTSFNAPSLGDTRGSPDTRAVLLAVAPFRDPADPESDFNRPEIILAGGNPNLGPQEADTWSVGLDVQLPMLPELTFSATYYNIHMTDQIAMIPLFTPAAFLPVYATYVIRDPTLEQLQALVGDMRLENGTSLAALYGGHLGDPYAVLDARRQNLSAIKQEGIDLSAAYQLPTDFGSINANIAGTHTLSREVAAVAGAPFLSEIESPGVSTLNLLATVGAKFGNFSASASLIHTGGYDISPAIGDQKHVRSFNTVDLFFGYDVHRTAAGNNTTLTLNISNLFDEDPPFYNQDPGYHTTTHSTLGRLVAFGVGTRF